MVQTGMVLLHRGKGGQGKCRPERQEQSRIFQQVQANNHRSEGGGGLISPV